MKRISVCFLTLAVVSLLASTAVAQATVNTLLTFGQAGTFSGNSEANLVFDSAGNLYGTTGDSQASSIFQLTPNGDGTWTENVLWDGNGLSDAPWSIRPGVVSDASGNLYATSFQGGSSGCGTAFRILPSGDGTWSYQNLVEFACNGQSGSAKGSMPVGGLTFDSAGNIYGTATRGGIGNCSSGGCGTIYKLTPNGSGFTFSVIYSFTGGRDGSYPNHPYLVFDSSGALYGTAAAGGIGTCNGFNTGCGTVFKLTPNTNGSWTFHLLHQFNGDDGGGPDSTLVFDQAGNLYGTTYSGGEYGYGVAFELVPESNGSWSERVLHAFRSGTDGAQPDGGLIFDAAGNLYGTTTNGGNDLCSYEGVPGCGTVFELSRTASGEMIETVLVRFNGAPENWPTNSLLMDSSGNLYGTAAGYNTDSLGSIYEVVR